MFKKILIANRGEIACRVIKTAAQLGVHTVAVYSDADQSALFVDMADEAYYLGPSESKESYLNQHKIIQIAKQAKAEAIHPGYGFLSENPDFAQLCADNQLIFIGPSPAAIKAMGSKSHAKHIMEKSQVPLLPGYHGTEQDADKLQIMAEHIGYPILIKASSGGGGKGMRIVEKSADFNDALLAVKREAKKSFGDDEILLEKYLNNPRHIEIQVLADQHQHYLHLFERDCSIQRRHQKVIEEAPACHFSADLRQQMGNAALAACRAINYVGAGTVEFLLDENQQFYFMEMNTRLQVEHPVTEMITGLDLVEWQLRIASFEPLTLTQADLTIQGHAIEARIYAEDPQNHFLPSIGKIIHYQTPTLSAKVRVDTGIREGDSITPYYDPMIAKLIVWDKTRELAIRRLQRALSQYQIVGVHHNISFLLQIAHHAHYQQGLINTHFIPNNLGDLLNEHAIDNATILALASLYRLILQSQFQYPLQHGDADSPWQETQGWRLNLSYQQVFKFIIDHETISVTIDYLSAKNYRLSIKDQIFLVHGTLQNTQLTAVINDRKWCVTLIQEGNKLNVLGHGLHYCLQLQALTSLAPQTEDQKLHLVSPMPGTIISILVHEKDEVSKGQALLIMEAMKMEHTLFAPYDGVVDTLFYQQGDMVDEGVELLKLCSEASLAIS